MIYKSTYYLKVFISIFLLSLVLLTPKVGLGSDITIIGKKLNLDYFVALVGALVFGWRFIFKKDRREVSRIVFLSVLGIIVLGVLALFFTKDISYLKNFLFLLKNMFRFYLFYILANKLFGSKDPWTTIAYSLVPFVLITIFFQFNPSFAQKYFEFTLYPPEVVAYSLAFLRTSWLGHTTWEYTVLFSFFFCLKVATSKLTPRSVAISSLILLGSVLYGRNWIVIFPIFILLNLFSLKKTVTVSLFFLIDFLLVIVATILLYKFFLQETDYLKWIWELFYRFFTSNEFSSVSTEGLSVQHKAFVDEYVFNWKSFLMGEGRYTVINNGVTQYYRQKDSGYIRELLCVGALFSGVLYSLITIFFLKSNFMQKYKLLSLFLLISTFILQIKGDIIFFSFGIYFLIELFSYECEPKTDNDSKSFSSCV